MLERINSYVWGGGLIFLLLFTGAVYTVRLRFIQLRLIPYLLRSRKNSSDCGGSGLSQLKTVCMSLGTAMGTGNITGVASALAIGGPGAVFWMWVSAFFGMALVYAENSLSVRYSDKDCRGPMAYLGKGLGSKALAAAFAVCCLLASLGMGGMVQVSSLSESITRCTDISGYVIAIGVFMAIYLVIRGGSSSIGSAAQLLLPLATVLYSVLCIAVLIKNRSDIAPVFRNIFSQALGLRQTAGGISGYAVSRAVSVGIRRGIFSNEAGLGSSPILHSAAESSSPGLQGMWSMFEVFLDTMICCTLSAAAILCGSEDMSISGAFSSVLGAHTDKVIAAVMAVFAFCTVIGWYYCGETAYRYISGKSSAGGFPLIYAAAAASGAVISAGAVWTLSDIFNGLMAVPNLAGLLLLIKKVKRE